MTLRLKRERERERESKKLLSQNVPLSEEAIGRVENDKGCINVFIFFLLVSNTKPKINTAKVVEMKPHIIIFSLLVLFELSADSIKRMEKKKHL